MTVFMVKRDLAYPQLRVNDDIVTGRSVFGWEKIERSPTFRNPYVKVF
jgi:hypothetical protein